MARERFQNSWRQDPRRCDAQVDDMHARRAALSSRLSRASLKLEGLCLLSDVLRERLEAIEMKPDCPGACGRCAENATCDIRRKVIALEASVADLNRSVTQLQRLLGNAQETGKRR